MAKAIKLADVVPSRFVHLTPPNEENIERIKSDLLTGSKMILNDPHAFRNEDGKWELLAGHDRVAAARRANWTEIQVRDFTGTSTVANDDAILAHFCKENLLRKETSKAAIAGEWLKRHPDWTDGVIADACGCTQQHVSDTRADMVALGTLQHVVARTGRDGKTHDAPEAPRAPRPRKKGALGKPQPKKANEPESAEEIAAKLAARTVPAPQAVAPTRPSAEPREAETKTPEPSDTTAVVGSTSPALPETWVGEPTGVVPPAPVEDVSTALSGEEGAVPEAASLTVGASALVAEKIAALDTLPTFTAPEYRAAALSLHPSRIENARAWHRFLSTFLLQAEIARKPETAGAAA